MKGFFDSVFSDRSLKVVQLADLKLPRTPNAYLAADREQTNAKTRQPALRLAASTDDVSAAIRDIAEGDLGAIERSDQGVLLFIDRTPLMRFPDGLYAWVDEIEGQSRVALFSRSVFGRRDFGVNKKRIEYMIQELRKRFPNP